MGPCHNAPLETPPPSDSCASTPGRELHVIADARAAWHVYGGDDPVALSEHTNATDAELDAVALADEHGAHRIVIHDCYHRTHDALPARATGDPSRIRPTTGRNALKAHESPGELPWWLR